MNRWCCDKCGEMRDAVSLHEEDMGEVRYSCEDVVGFSVDVVSYE